MYVNACVRGKQGADQGGMVGTRTVSPALCPRGINEPFPYAAFTVRCVPSSLPTSSMS